MSSCRVCGSCFLHRGVENAADWETTEDLPVEESAEHGIIKNEDAKTGLVKEKDSTKHIRKIKNSELANGLPIKGSANTTVDKTDDNGKVLQRRIYGDDGMAMVDIDTSDHGLPKAHPKGAHKHIFDHSKKKPRGNPQPLTEEELTNHKDIIQKGENDRDQSRTD